MVIVDRTKEFLAQPFRADMDAVGWFLFFGLILAIAFAWALITKHLQELA